MEIAKILPATFLKYQMDKNKNSKALTISVKETSVNTNLAEITGDEVNGKTDNTFMVNESGLPKVKKARATGIAGTMINDPRADVLGSLIVAAIAAKKVFQKSWLVLPNCKWPTC